MTEYSNTKVFIAIDDEGMLGGMSSEEIAQIDIEATYTAYLEKCVAEIKKTYPGIEVETSIGPTTYSTKVYSSDLDEQEIGEMTDIIQEIGGMIYEKADFWAEKNF